MASQSNLVSLLLDFYRGLETDIEGRFLNDILAWPDDDFEAVHNFIQWLFPLPEPSRFNPDAPLLAKEDIAAFKTDPVLQANLMNSFERILFFLGLMLSEGKVVAGMNFTARVSDVWAIPNHNWLRISRILRSLTLLGMEDQSQALYEWLNATYTSRKFPISADTFRYWTEAVGRWSAVVKANLQVVCCELPSRMLPDRLSKPSGSSWPSLNVLRGPLKAIRRQSEERV